MRRRRSFSISGKTTLYLLSATLLIAVSSSVGLACSCVPPSDEPQRAQVQQAKRESHAVFAGKVVSFFVNSEGDYISVKLQVTGVWKGSLTREVAVLTGRHGGNCRFPFKVGETYLVYARYISMYTDERSLTTHMCLRTSVFSEGKSDVPFLGMKRRPRTTPVRKTRRANSYL